MEKGVTALQNLKLMREARSRQITLLWNFLVGIPGELEKEYEPILDILPAIVHFQPPKGVFSVHIDRYSPYFCNPSRFNIKNVRPFAAYKQVYPANANLEQLVYSFDADYESILSGDLHLYKLINSQCYEWTRSWQCLEDRPLLHVTETTGGLRMIKDTRKIAKQTFTALCKESYELLNILAEPTGPAFIPVEFQQYLPELVDRQFVLDYENHYISVVTDPRIGMRLRKHGNSLTAPDVVSGASELEKAVNLERMADQAV